nr:hypothetical protein [Abalone asfa-like virus]
MAPSYILCPTIGSLYTIGVEYDGLDSTSVKLQFKKVERKGTQLYAVFKYMDSERELEVKVGRDLYNTSDHQMAIFNRRLKIISTFPKDRAGNFIPFTAEVISKAELQARYPKFVCQEIFAREDDV